MDASEFGARVAARETIIGVIGLGYVGLPVACSFAEAGFHVIGVDVKPEWVRQVNGGRNPIGGEEPGLAELLARVVADGRLLASTDYQDLARADVVLIDVETPVDDQHCPRYVALTAACRSLGPVLKPGALVVVESSVAPGTVDGVVRPLLEETSGGRAGCDFFLGACPERVMPGRLLRNLSSMSRVCGGTTPETSQAMIALYETIVHADLDAAEAVTAELVKTAENAYRDVQIAFANEVALICEAAGGDVWKVRDLVNKSPGRQMHMPGAGVGGHCIPKDPWLLAYGAGGRAPLRLIPAARAVNDGMPLHVAELTLEVLAEAGVGIAGARVAVLGYAYLEESNDTRNSPSAILVARLRELGAEVVVHDPWVPEYRGDLLERVRGCDAVVVMVAHREYRGLDLHALRNALCHAALVDGRGIVPVASAADAGYCYRSIGKGSTS